MENFTPFPNLRFYNTDSQGKEFGVLLVKGTYGIAADGHLTILNDQDPLVLTDTYHGALNTSSLWLPSDLVPKKPRTDVILNAVARAPGGEPSPSWICGLRVEGDCVLEKRLRVTGPRQWEPIWKGSAQIRATLNPTERRRLFEGWRLSEPEPVAEVPIRYEFAYGGLQARPREGHDEPFFQADERNPIGRGWIDTEQTPAEAPVPAPQIEDVAEPIVDPYRSYAPAGFGPIPPAWLPRRPLGGTFDDHWREHVWPNWPSDYKFAYHNSAHADLVYPRHLIGDETVRLFGLDGRAEERVICLPGHGVAAALDRANGGPIAAIMELDTLLLDVADANPGEHRAFLSWRIVFDHLDAEGVTFVLADLPARPRPAQQSRSEQAA